MKKLGILGVLVFILWAPAIQGQQIKTWPKPAEFDGDKFAKRYGLSIYDFGETLIGGVPHIYVKDGNKITDKSPIFEPPDPPKKAVTIDDLLKRIEVLEKRLGK